MRRALVTLALLLLLPVVPVPAQTNAPLYAPAIAGPNSTLVGTTGPNGSISIDFRETGNRKEHRTISADGSGRFVLRAPANAVGIDFSVSGAIAHTVISADRKLIVGGLVPRRAASGALAIVAAQAAYDVHQPVLLQVEHFDPLAGRVIVDENPIQLLAGSDRSVVAKLGESIPLGRHGVGISGKGAAIEVQADIVKTSLSVTGPNDYRIPRTVTLGVDGLFGDRASVTFDVTGGAVLANDKDEITVPVTPPGQATTTVTANKPGEVNLRWKLNVDLGLKYNYSDYYETPRPYTATPTPVPTPLIPCTIRLTDGWFEAVQGPYQDDPVFTQKPERLLREDGNTISYYGQLDMIKSRPSALMGVLEYSKDGTLVKVDSRNNIVMKGETNCSEYAAVKIRFTLHEQGEGPHVIYTSPIAGYVFFKGHAESKFTPWQASVPTFDGVPETPFTFNVGANHYAIDAELVDEHDHGLGLKMWLNGYTEVTTGPLLRLLPLLLSHSKSDAQTQERQDGLVAEAKRLQGELFEHIPDIYPLKPHGLPMPQVAEPIDLTGKNIFDTSWDDAISFDITIRNRHQQNLQAALDDRFATTTVLQGASRTVALLVNSDFDALVGPGALGYTMSTKLVAVKWTQPWTTPGHEVAHTLPTFLWSSVQMQAQCDKNYHNTSDGVAYGLQTMKLSNPITGQQHFGWPFDIMQGAGDEAWISQCTYDNLIGALRGPVDPLMLVVRFYLARPVHGGVVGRLRPAYITPATLSQTVRAGKFTITAYNAGGGVVQKGTFDPQWSDENNFDRNIISVQYRFKYDPAIARIDLRAPNNTLLDSMTVSKIAPTVAVDRATRAGRKIHVAWRGTGEARRELLYSVFLSSDKKVFYEWSFERPETHIDLTLRRHSTFRPRFVKVVVTDGSRSAETIAALR
ncbi:MAG TPA: hypothetical protein VFO29_03785 [Candidatus Rubrimentiphilum sp.]|nr:hypothetical protein [Candidatus Rubrimentiphilum sp.]